MTPEPLIHWPDPFLELLGFVAAFLASGAVGYRYFAARGLATAGVGPSGEESRLAANALARAASWGCVGAVVALVQFGFDLPETAARQHMGVLTLVTTQPMMWTRIAFSALGMIGLLAAAGRRGWGWPLALVGVVGSPLRGLLFGQWLRIVNPAHELFAGFWIGTLFVLVTAALVPLRRSALDPERRGAIAAALVRAFSPWALFSFGALATFGLITAWRHLKKLDALWTTPYGWTLIVKLSVVAIVLALGAWNWRRQLPRLGSAQAAHDLERSASIELAVAFVVLLVTSILVSLPSPS